MGIRRTALVAAAIVGVVLAVVAAVSLRPNVVCTGCPDQVRVDFQMIATRENNGSVYFGGSITNEGLHPFTGMRILVNGTGFGGNWTATYVPHFPAPGTPLTSGSTLFFHAFLPPGVPHGGWPIACQSFTCKAGDRLYVEVEVYDGQGGVATSGQLVTMVAQ